jgi:hypothetical protein
LDGTEGDESRFHVFLSRTRLRRYRGRHVPFLSFALPDTFLAVPWASGLVFKFWAPGHVFCGTYDVGYHFQVLLTRTRFRRYGKRRGSFLCFVLADSF